MASASSAEESVQPAYIYILLWSAVMFLSKNRNILEVYKQKVLENWEMAVHIFKQRGFLKLEAVLMALWSVLEEGKCCYHWGETRRRGSFER